MVPVSWAPAAYEAELLRLSRSRFRSRFRLNSKDRAYAQARGRETLEKHAQEFLFKRLGAALPERDGRQTPMRGHPVFTAQHATGTCCRGCLARWHRIPQGRAMTADEITWMTGLILTWIKKQMDPAQF